MAKSKAVTKTEQGGDVATLSDTRPDFLKTGSIRGTETLGREDLLIPRVQVLQALSPEVQDGHRVGHLYHNILEEIVQDQEGDNTLSIIPIMCRVRYVLWRPRHAQPDGSSGGMLAVAEDGVNWDKPGQEFKVRPVKGDGYEETWKIGKTVKQLTMGKGDKPNLSIADFGSGDLRNESSAPAATKSYNYLCLAANRLDLGPFIVIMQRTSEGTGKRLNQRIRTAGVDSFAQCIGLGAKYVDDGPDNKYWQYQFSAKGYVDEASYKKAETIYETFSAMDAWNIKDEEAEQAAAPVEDDGDVSDEM